MPTIEEIRKAAQDLQLDINEEVIDLLASHTPPVIAAGVSGGRDSGALVLLLNDFLSRINYQGERLLIHADLGRIEHAESLGHIKRLATFVDWKLLITRREKGDLLDRYEQRWQDNSRRFARLECVNLISPWPQPNNGRFCTSELKTGPITRTLANHYPGQVILNCIGLRAEESRSRALKEIFQVNSKLRRAIGTTGYNWLPIHTATIETSMAPAQTIPVSSSYPICARK